jgi:2-methylcitrate dehydratase PrpD
VSKRHGDLGFALASYVERLSFSEFEPATVERAEQAVLDVIGIALRARYEAPSGGAFHAAAATLGGDAGSCTAIGWASSYTAQSAALLNAANAHSLEFDDTHEAALIHPGAPVVAAALATAEERNADGRALLTAIVAGYDVAVRLSLAAGAAALWRRGFSPTPVCGGFGATAAVAKVRGATANELANAFGIHLSQTGGSTQYADNGAWTHALQVGFAAHNAIVADRYAWAGVIGPSHALEGKAGLLHSYSDAGDPRLVLDAWDGVHEIDRTGFKLYPSCRYTHGAIDVIGDLVREHHLRADEIERIRIGLSATAAGWVGGDAPHKRVPRTIGDAQFSMYFCAALAVLKGTLIWDDYRDLEEARILQMAKRIAVTPDPRADALEPQLAAFVELDARGQTLARMSIVARGAPERAVGWSEVSAKFESLVGSFRSQAWCERLISIVRGLDSAAPVRTLTTQLGAEVARI